MTKFGPELEIFNFLKFTSVYGVLKFHFKLISLFPQKRPHFICVKIDCYSKSQPLRRPQTTTNTATNKQTQDLGNCQ